MTDTTIPLGFAVPGGERVTIPLGHMAVTGQTQSAGKTTALEALAMRSGCAVLAFVTKRGERAFVNAPVRTNVPPYLHERTDWEYVESILEAVMRERMKRERYWIMQVSRGAMTLAGVQANIKAQLTNTKLKDYVAEQYHLLDAYLDKVVPQIGMLPAAREFTELLYGINVMDLSPFSSELQGLVIASCLEYVFQHCVNTIVVIPEAWEFLPQGRKSPVTYAAEAFIRKGGTLKNYLWIDSQDLAGVHTPILKQIHVWLLGVQREINEIKRTLAHLHGISNKPTPGMVASLGLGQFVACFGKQAVTTYVRPNWITDSAARRVARGEGQAPIAPRRIIARGTYVGNGGVRDIDLGMGLLPPGTSYVVTPVRYADFERQPPQGTFTEFTPAEDPMDAQLKADNERLAKDNQTLAGRIAELEPIIDTLRREIKTLRDRLGFAGEEPIREPPIPPDRRAGTTPLHGRPLDDNGGIEFTSPDRAGKPPITADLDWHYIRAKILNDPDIQAAVAKILVTRPELVVEVSPKVLTLEGATPRGRLAKLIADGFLDTPVKPAAILREFKRTGPELHPSRLSDHLIEFVASGFLIREEGALYVKAPKLKITTKELQATI